MLILEKQDGGIKRQGVSELLAKKKMKAGDIHPCMLKTASRTVIVQRYSLVGNTRKNTGIQFMPSFPLHYKKLNYIGSISEVWIQLFTSLKIGTQYSKFKMDKHNGINCSNSE